MAQIQTDRPAAAQELAERYGCVAVLKGSGTLIAAPGREMLHNPTGNPGLAAAAAGMYWPGCWLPCWPRG